MAATTYAGGSHTTAAGSKSVTATPAANDLILIFSASSGLANALDTLPTDGQSGTYIRAAIAQGSASTELIAAYIRTALVPAAVSTTFTHALSSSNTGGGLTVYRVSGMTKVGLAALLQAAVQSGGAANTTPAPTFGAAVTSTNPVLGGVMANQATANAITPPTNYTEGAELTYTTPSRVLEVVSRDSGETGTTITWGSTVQPFGALAVELDSSSGAPASHPSTFGTII